MSMNKRRPPPPPKPRNQKLMFFIQEIIDNEKEYVGRLRRIIEDYQPFLYERLDDSQKQYIPEVFGNIDQIYEAAKTFHASLLESDYSIYKVMNAFYILSKSFECYIEYSRYHSRAKTHLSRFKDIAAERTQQLNDSSSLFYSMAYPLLKLTKYRLMLENLEKVLDNETILNKIKNIKSAISITIKKCDDNMAIGVIKNCALDLTKQGSFIRRQYFNILSPRKFESMVFLFENIILFTENIKDEDNFQYIYSIEMRHLCLKTTPEARSFTLIDFSITKPKSINDSSGVFELEPESEAVKDEWVHVLQDKLWKQLQEAKESRGMRAMMSEPTVTSTNLNNEITRSSVFYIRLDK